jgi:uncharacterized protein YkwD
MKTRLRNIALHSTLALSALLWLPTAAHADGPITHQITLPSGASWCSDAVINGLLDQINSYRTQNGVAALLMDPLGMKDSEMRAVQFAAYMATHPVGSPGFNPHTGYDTTAASLGYNLISEDLAYMTSDPGYIVWSLWDSDSLHLAAMMSRTANIAGVSCIYSSGTPYVTYDPGCSPSFCGQTLPITPPTTPPGTLDSQEWAFLSLVNQYRAQNGAGPLQVSAALQNASTWMSTDMATNNYSSHTDSLGRSPGTRLAAFNYPYSPWGENIAGGYSDAQSVFAGWQSACDPDSSGNCTYAHRANMLYSGFQVIGIGRAYGANSSYGWYWTTDFGGVVDQTISPPPAGAPAIAAFSASPSSIAAGQSSLLAWSISGATSISISGGVGDVSTVTSKSVSPAQTTTYTLTADTQPPTAPALLSAIAKSPTEVDLTWTASTDNVGVAGYQVVRNGTVLTTVTGGALSYADTSALGGLTYLYSIIAYDAAGNLSPASNTITINTPGGCPAAAATGAFTGCYYNNINLTGSPVLIRTDNQINFDWYLTPPDPSVPASGFSIRWQGNFTFAAGLYNFSVIVSDGMRVYIDGNKVLDGWRDQAPRRYSFSSTVTQGNHLIAVEYYHNTGTPTAHLSWQSSAPAPSPLPVISSFVATPSTVMVGQFPTLSWSTTGATTITLDNGIGNVSNRTWELVSPTQTTTYTLTATNSAGSVTARATITVSTATPPPQPPPGPPGTVTCPAPATGAFTGCYYNTLDLTGNPVFERTDSQINFDWSSGPPAASVTPNNFSVRWQGNFTFASGNYTFTVNTSDGMRIYIDGTLVFNRWMNMNPPRIMALHTTLTQGNHLITVEYYEATGDPTAHVSWIQN